MATNKRPRKAYKRIGFEDRKKIEALNAQGKTVDEIAAKGTDHEHTYFSCDGCPFNVEKFGEHKIYGCVLRKPDEWDEPKVSGYVVRTIIHEMAGDKK